MSSCAFTLDQELDILTKYLAGLSCAKLANLFFVTPMTILRVLKRNNISRRKRHENNTGCFKKGHIPWHKGKKLSEDLRETQKQIRLKLYVDHPELREKISIATKLGMQDPNVRERGSFLSLGY
jgi:IS30 family transposase